MAAPIFVHVVPINDQPKLVHQDSRDCWCGPIFAVDIRPTLGRDDIRVMLHRSAQTDMDSFNALHARKGEIVALA